jgi:hypothetical protein
MANGIPAFNCFAKTEQRLLSVLLHPRRLTKVFKKMDVLGITKRNVEENDQPCYPCVIIDGYTLQMYKGFLTCINKPLTKWIIALGAPYGTALWQLHDDKRQNGAFKSALVNAKKKMNLKKRVHKLMVGISPQEIVLVIRDAVDSSVMNVRYTLLALSHRDMYPFNRNPLMDPKILAVSLDNVLHERTAVLHMRGDAYGECSLDTHCVIYVTNHFVHSPFLCCVLKVLS